MHEYGDDDKGGKAKGEVHGCSSKSVLRSDSA